MLQVIKLRKSYKLGPVEVEILKGVDMNIEKGELVSIIGKSGCGKSTMMNILGFLDTPTSGQYFFEGKETSNLSDKELSAIRNQNIGFVFQQFYLLNKLSALENVCLPLLYRGIKEKKRIQIAREMLNRVGMSDRENHKPAELSGGQQQRVAIARALSGNPSLILADEPTGALDTAVGQDIMNLFLELNNQQKITIIIITHDSNIARQCNRVIKMIDGKCER